MLWDVSLGNMPGVMSMDYMVREVTNAADVDEVRRLVMAHGDARSTTPGVEYVYADAARMPGPYIPPLGGLWLAVSADVGIGCGALRPVDDTSAEVKRMFVDSTWRGRGVGRALMVALIAGARARGYATLRLGTLDDMTAARTLYESLGFVPIGRYRADELIDTRFYQLELSTT
ncbi:MAG: putative acetyltransferase [Gemmatimonadetes bacterium]|nr:putative acetyltransferase [Gemmatimonadota bacterium]